MERALYFNRTAALLAAIEAGRKRGVSDDLIAYRSNAYPVYKRSQLVGWEAWFPLDAEVRSPVMEGAT